MDDTKARYEIYKAKPSAGTGLVFTKVSEASTRREAVEKRQMAAKEKDVTVYLYTDGRLDKIGIHKK